MTRIVIGATAIYGHVTPLVTIAKDLVGRGHEVTFLTGSAFKAMVQAAGASFVPVPGRADLDMSVEAARPERLAIPAGIERFDYDMRELFVASIPGQFRALQDLFAEARGEPVIFIGETGFWGIAPLLLGAPGLRPAATIGVGVTPLTASSVDTAPFGMGLPPDSSPAGRQKNAELNTMVMAGPLSSAQNLYRDILTGLEVTEEIPFFLDTVVKRTDRFLQLSIEDLSYVRSDTPDSVRYVGALPAEARDVPLPEWWRDVVDAETVVVVTQGTFGNTDLSELIEPTLDALENLPVLVVATTGDERQVRRLPANARAAAYVPYADLLPHTDVLVTNGGFGGVQQALSHGVPMVLAGVSEEKLEGNVRTAATGAAIDLATQNPTPDEIRSAVIAVLEQPAYQGAATRLQAVYQALDPLDAIAGTVDELGRKTAPA